MKKRILATVLSLMMVLQLVPMSAFAAEQSALPAADVVQTVQAETAPELLVEAPILQNVESIPTEREYPDYTHIVNKAPTTPSAGILGQGTQSSPYIVDSFAELKQTMELIATNLNTTRYIVIEDDIIEPEARLEVGGSRGGAIFYDGNIHLTINADVYLAQFTSKPSNGLFEGRRNGINLTIDGDGTFIVDPQKNSQNTFDMFRLIAGNITVNGGNFALFNASNQQYQSMFSVEYDHALTVNGGSFYVEGYTKPTNSSVNYSGGSLISYEAESVINVNGGVFYESELTHFFAGQYRANRPVITNGTFISDSSDSILKSNIFDFDELNYYTHAVFEEKEGYLNITTPFVNGQTYQLKYINEDSTGDTTLEPGFTTYKRTASTIEEAIAYVDALESGQRLDLKLEGGDISYGSVKEGVALVVKGGTKVVLDLNGAQVNNVSFRVDVGGVLDVIDTAGGAYVTHYLRTPRYLYRDWVHAEWRVHSGYYTKKEAGSKATAMFNVLGELNIHGGTFRMGILETHSSSEKNEIFSSVVHVYSGTFNQYGGVLQGETKPGETRHLVAGITMNDDAIVNLYSGKTEAPRDTTRMLGIFLRTDEDAEDKEVKKDYQLYIKDYDIVANRGFYSVAYGHNFVLDDYNDNYRIMAYVSGYSNYTYVDVLETLPTQLDGCIDLDNSSNAWQTGDYHLYVQSSSAPPPPPDPIPSAETPKFTSQPKSSSYDFSNSSIGLNSIADLTASAEIDQVRDPDADVTYQWFKKAPWETNYTLVSTDTVNGSGDVSTLNMNDSWFIQDSEVKTGVYRFYCVATNTRPADDGSFVQKSSNVVYVEITNRHETPDIEFVPTSSSAGMIRVANGSVGEQFVYSINGAYDIKATLDSNFAFPVVALNKNDDISVWRPASGNNDRSFSASHFVEQAEWPSEPTFVIDDTDPGQTNGSVTVTGANLFMEIERVSVAGETWRTINTAGETISSLWNNDVVIVSYQELGTDKLYAETRVARVGQHRYDSELEAQYETFTTVWIATNSTTITDYILKKETDTTFPSLPTGLRWDASERTLILNEYSGNSIHLGEVGKVKFIGTNEISADAYNEFAGLSNRSFTIGSLGSPDYAIVEGGRNVTITSDMQAGDSLTIDYSTGGYNLPSLSIAGDLSLVDASVVMYNDGFFDPIREYTMIDVDGDMTLSGRTSFSAISNVYGIHDIEGPNIIADVGGNLNLASSGNVSFIVDQGGASVRDHSVSVSGDVIVSGEGTYKFMAMNDIDMMEIGGEIILQDPDDYEVFIGNTGNSSNISTPTVQYDRKSTADIISPTSIIANDSLAGTVYRDRDYTLSATVLPATAPQGIVWSVSGNLSEATYITMRYGEAELRVGAGETAQVITVTGSSATDPDIKLVRHFNVAVVTENLTGSVTIQGSATMGSLLTIASENVSSEGVLSYNWFVSDNSSGTDPSYIVGEWGDTHRVDGYAGRYIGVAIRSSFENGEVRSNVIGPIQKGTAPDAPTGLEGVPPTTSGGNDGYILGTTWDMEWKLSSASADKYSWTNGDTIDDLAPGEYHVRYKETQTAVASGYTTVTVPSYSAISYTGISVSIVGDDTPIGNSLSLPAGSITNLKVTVTGTGAFDRGATWTIDNESQLTTGVTTYDDGKTAILEIAPLERRTMTLRVRSSGSPQKIITITVAGDENHLSSVYQEDFIEGVGAVSPTVSYNGSQNGGDVTFEYKNLNDDTPTYTSEVPTSAGSYGVMAISAAEGTVVESSVESTFYITKPLAPRNEGVINFTIDADDTSAKTIDLSEYIPSGLNTFEYEGQHVTYVVDGSVSDSENIIAQNTYLADGTTPTFGVDDLTPIFNLSSGLTTNDPPQEAQLRFTIITADYAPINVQVNVALTRVEVILGDVNGSGRVDVNDLRTIADSGNYNRRTTGSDAATNPNTDVNGDGKVNFLDLAIARNSKNFGK